jgi:rubrerythrin
MARSKHSKSSEYYLGEIRKLKKEVQQLRRELQKYQPSQEDTYTTDDEDTHPKVFLKEKTCLDCGKGKLKTFEIIGRVFEECPICGARKKLSGP